MLRLGNANAIVIQGLIASRGLDCLKALILGNLRISLEEEKKEKEKNTSP